MVDGDLQPTRHGGRRRVVRAGLDRVGMPPGEHGYRGALNGRRRNLKVNHVVVEEGSDCIRRQGVLDGNEIVEAEPLELYAIDGTADPAGAGPVVVNGGGAAKLGAEVHGAGRSWRLGGGRIAWV